MDPRWEVVLFALYVVPSLVVAARRPTKTLLVIAVTLLLGWTIIGWFVSVALALLLPPAAAQPSHVCHRSNTGGGAEPGRVTRLSVLVVLAILRVRPARAISPKSELLVDFGSLLWVGCRRTSIPGSGNASRTPSAGRL